MRWLLLSGLWAVGWAQGWCFQPPSTTGLAQWRMYHLLPDGRGEAIAQAVFRLLLEDSVVRYVRYVYHVQVRYYRQGGWMVLDGEATEEGAYAFFHALRGAVDRFPQVLQNYQGREIEAGEWPQVAARWLWRDTLDRPTALQVSQFYYEVWLGGQVKVVYWGRQGGLIRRLFPFFGQDTLKDKTAYPWPGAPSGVQALPAQEPIVFYSRWSVSEPSWASLLALWAYLKKLETYLCEEKQLSCQFFWSPTPMGMEVWIYTSLPYATAQALESFLAQRQKPGTTPIYGRFIAWQREAAAQYLLGQWLCLWRLGKYQEPPPKQIQQAYGKIRGTFWPVSR